VLRVLIDTSAWIEFYHPMGSEKVKKAIIQALELHEVTVVAPVIVELLSGAKTRRDYETLKQDLFALSWLPLDEEVTVMAAKLAWKLARSGKRVPTVDLLIAAAAKQNGCELWHFGDRHFEVIASVCSLAHRNLKG
jgi:hypothetical protein